LPVEYRILGIDGRRRLIERGAMTLSDLLVALLVLGLVMAANLTLLDGGARAYEIGAARVEAQQAARIALARMARDLRTAGAGVAATFPAVSVAEPSRVVFHRDENQDGVIAGTRETITWKLAGDVLRRDAGGGAQPIIDGARALSLSYVDADGEPTTDPAAVRTVRITLTAAPVGAGAATGVTTTVSTQVRSRNR
jgi:type II secretory pathway component PulJ